MRLLIAEKPSFEARIRDLGLALPGTDTVFTRMALVYGDSPFQGSRSLMFPLLAIPSS